VLVGSGYDPVKMAQARHRPEPCWLGTTGSAGIEVMQSQHPSMFVPSACDVKGNNKKTGNGDW
jgi:hypothetical protein